MIAIVVAAGVASIAATKGTALGGLFYGPLVGLAVWIALPGRPQLGRRAREREAEIEHARLDALER